MNQQINQKSNQSEYFHGGDLALKVIMDWRTDESCNMKINLGFRLHDVITTKEQTALNP